MREGMPESLIYFNGQEVGPRKIVDQETSEHHRNSVELFRSYMSEIVEGKKQPFVFFDVDGTVIPAEDYETGETMPVETGKNTSTIEDYVVDHQYEINQFKSRITNLANRGFKFGINTGRGIGFAKRIVEHIFPEGMVSVIIGESGAGILESNGDGTWKSELTKPNTVTSESYAALAKYKNQIEEVAREVGGFVEDGKEVIVSVNPPYETEIGEFEEQLKSKLLEASIPIEELSIVHSNSAVDIGPKGAKKIEALKQVLGDNIAIYFGDASNDEEAMRGSDVNVVVGNANPSTKETAKKNIDGTEQYVKPGFGIVVDKANKDINGSIEGLRSIEQYWRYEKRRRSQEALHTK